VSETVENQSDEKRKDLEWQKLDLEKQRLQIEIDNYEVSRKLESEKIALEKAKERTTKLQIILPLAVSAVAILMGPLAQTYNTRLAARDTFQYQLRLELFKKTTKAYLIRQMYYALLRLFSQMSTVNSTCSGQVRPVRLALSCPTRLQSLQAQCLRLPIPPPNKQLATT